MTSRLREMKAELSFLKNADGSTCFSQGSTCVWASCSGPGDVHASRANEEVMTLDVSFRGNCGDNKYHPLNNILVSTLKKSLNLELFPHTTLVVTVHGVQDDGSIGAAALNGTCFALLDNGVPFDSVFCGISVVRVNNELVLDPTSKQESQSDAQILFAVSRNKSGEPEICSMDTIGSLEFEEIENAWKLAKPSAATIFDFYRNVLERKHSCDQN